MKQYKHILLEVLNQYLSRNLLLTEDQERTIRNKIARGVAAITNMDVASQEVQSMTDDIWNTYVKHPIEGEKRQNDEVWAINTVINRLIPYAVRSDEDGKFFVNKSIRVKNAFENLIQSQRKEQKSKKQLWNNDESLHYWNVNKKYNDAIEASKEYKEGKYHYTVYKVEDYDTPIEGLGMTVTELGKYTGGKGAVPLCYTQGHSTYDSYTKNNAYDMYALLRDGWKDEQCEMDETTYPLDSYGLSIIFVIVNPNNGKIEFNNVRWNHGPERYNRSVDNIFSYKELRDIVGSDIMKQINTKSAVDKELQLTHDIEEKLNDENIPLKDIFPTILYVNRDLYKVYVENCCNFINPETRELLSDIWFSSVFDFKYGIVAEVLKDGKWNLFFKDGTLAIDTEDISQWFDGAKYLGRFLWFVSKNNKFNIYDMSKKEFVSTIWFDNIMYDEYNIDSFIIVVCGKKFNLIGKNGLVIKRPIEKWLDNAKKLGNFINIVVNTDLKTNIVNYYNGLLSEEWFDMIDINPDLYYGNGFVRGVIKDKFAQIYLEDNNIEVKFTNGETVIDYKRKSPSFKDWYIVTIGHNQNYMDKEGHFIFNTWFKTIDDITPDRLVIVRVHDYWNFITPQGKLLFDLPLTNWLDNISPVNLPNYWMIRKGWKFNIVTPNCTFLFDESLDAIAYLDNGLLLKKDEKQNMLIVDKETNQFKLAWDAPFDKWFDAIIGPITQYKFCEGEFWVRSQDENTNKPQIIAVKGDKILGIVAE